MGVRVEEVGESECLAVMARIGMKHVPRESGPTSDWSFVTKH
jgi:hypothetical protein